jgi:hypothetical protein
MQLDYDSQGKQRNNAWHDNPAMRKLIALSMLSCAFLMGIAFMSITNSDAAAAGGVGNGGDARSLLNDGITGNAAGILNFPGTRIEARSASLRGSGSDSVVQPVAAPAAQQQQQQQQQQQPPPLPPASVIRPQDPPPPVPPVPQPPIQPPSVVTAARVERAATTTTTTAAAAGNNNNEVRSSPGRSPHSRFWRGGANNVEDDAKAKSRSEQVKNAMKHSWNGYKQKAWGFDEMMPTSGRGRNRWGSMGMTIVDSLDTLWLMGMKDEFEDAKNWVTKTLDFGIGSAHGGLSMFETTIRALGGLLAAFELSKDTVFLDKAHQLGDGLFSAFSTKTGIAAAHVTYGSHGGGGGGGTTIAEAGTLQLEFTYLSDQVGKFSSYSARHQIKVKSKKQLKKSVSLSLSI